MAMSKRMKIGIGVGVGVAVILILGLGLGLGLKKKNSETISNDVTEPTVTESPTPTSNVSEGAVEPVADFVYEAGPGVVIRVTNLGFHKALAMFAPVIDNVLQSIAIPDIQESVLRVNNIQVSVPQLPQYGMSLVPAENGVMVSLKDALIKLSCTAKLDLAKRKKRGTNVAPVRRRKRWGIKLSTFTDPIKEVVSVVEEPIKEVITVVEEPIKEVVTAVEDTAVKTADTVADTTMDVVNSDIVQDAASAIQDAGETVVDTTKDVATDAVDATVDLAKDVANAVTNIDLGSFEVKAALKSADVGVKFASKNVSEIQLSKFSCSLNVEILDIEGGALADVAGAVVSAFKSQVKTIINTEACKAISNAIKGKVTDLVNKGFSGGIPFAASKLIEKLNDIQAPRTVGDDKSIKLSYKIYDDTPPLVEASAINVFLNGGYYTSVEGRPVCPVQRNKIEVPGQDGAKMIYVGVTMYMVNTMLWQLWDHGYLDYEMNLDVSGYQFKGMKATSAPSVMFKDGSADITVAITLSVLMNNVLTEIPVEMVVTASDVTIANSVASYSMAISSVNLPNHSFLAPMFKTQMEAMLAKMPTELGIPSGFAGITWENAKIQLISGAVLVSTDFGGTVDLEL